MNLKIKYQQLDVHVAAMSIYLSFIDHAAPVLHVTA